MAQNLPVQQCYDFITQDFESAWNALAFLTVAQAPGRGNFVFGWHAMTLLEWAARLCTGDSTGQAIADLSVELARIEPRYFTVLPGPCARPADFDLPFNPANGQKEAQLLWALHNLVRNGQAHQYQQILVKLKNGKDLGMQLVGVPTGCPFPTAGSTRPSEHLGYHIDVPTGDVWIKLHPDWLCFDFERAVMRSGLLTRGLSFPYLARPKPPRGPQRQLPSGTILYNFASTQLTTNLMTAGHTVW